jgi:polyhydroxybutyrate depolymerase
MNMKTFIFRVSLFVFAIVQFSVSAQTIKTIQHNSTTRMYMEFIPSSYTGTEALPLVIALHGLGDSINNFSTAGFQIIGEIDNFITVYPQGMSGFAGTAWNAGVQYYGITINGDVNDVSFISNLIDTISDDYNIDPERIYVTGFSMGGFMANRLACELSQKIAAIASVAGTRGNLLTTCQPWRAVPFCHFHGSADGTVYFTGNAFGMDAPDLVNWWATWNQCQTPPDSTILPDNAPGDGIIITHFEYPNGIQNSNVEFYRADSADHVWLYQPVNDTTYTILIWEFFKKHQLTTIDISEQSEENTYHIYPTIASDKIWISPPSSIPFPNSVRLYSTNGQITESTVKTDGSVDISFLPQGIYICEIENPGKQPFRGKFIVSR